MYACLVFLLNKKVNKYKKAIPFLAYFKLGNSFEDEFYIKKAVNVICLQRTQVHKFSKRWMECFLIKCMPPKTQIPIGLRLLHL